MKWMTRRERRTSLETEQSFFLSGLYDNYDFLESVAHVAIFCSFLLQWKGHPRTSGATIILHTVHLVHL